MIHKVITVGLLTTFNPCENRFRNFADRYPDFKGSLAELASLEHITYEDVAWVAKKVCSRNELISWAIACTDSVSHLVPAKCVESSSQMLDYLKSISDFDLLTFEQLEEIRRLCSAAYVAAENLANASIGSPKYAAVRAAARAAADAAADAAAYSAHSAAYSAADAAAYSAHSAAYSAADAAARAAAYAAHSAARAAYSAQEDINLMLLFSCLED